MDFGGILKRSWELTWRYKGLWILGLFAGGGVNGWGGSGYRFNRTSTSSSTAMPQVSAWLADASDFMQQWGVAVVAAAVVLLFLVALAWAALSIAAQGGLVNEVNAAQEGRVPSQRNGWAVGFHHWGRVALIGLLLLLPVVVLVLAVTVIGIAGVFVALSGTTDRIAGAILGLAALGVVLVPLLLIAGLVLGTMYQLALRYAIIEDRPALDSIGAAWSALKARFKDIALMWLVVLAVSIGFGMAIAIPAGMIGVAVFLTALAHAWAATVFLGVLLAVVAAVLGAGFSTYVSAAWTLFFRRLTGRDATAVASPVYATGVPGAGAPVPAPPMPPAPTSVPSAPPPIAPFEASAPSVASSPPDAPETP